MKPLKLFFFFLIIPTVMVHAQITNGNWLVGGDASFSSSKLEYENKTGISTVSGSTIGVYPNMGRFLIDKFAVGLVTNFNYNNTKNGPSSIGYGIGPFVRYYFLKTENKVNLLADVNFTYYSSKTDGLDSQTGNSYRIKAGPVIFFNNSVGLELTVNYELSKFDFTSNDFRIGIGFQIHLEK